MPKRIVDVDETELFRAVKLTDKTMQYYKFKNPIRTGFNKDFYPPYLNGEPALTYDEWASGKNVEPKRDEWDPNNLASAHQKK